MTMRHGQIVRLLLDGLAYLQENGTGTIYAFTFNKIESYRGESAEELGLALRTSVQFEQADFEQTDGVVTNVRSRRRRLWQLLPDDSGAGYFPAESDCSRPTASAGFRMVDFD